MLDALHLFLIVLEPQRTLQVSFSSMTDCWLWHLFYVSTALPFSPIPPPTHTHRQWFSQSVQLCPTICDPMNHSTPGLPVHHQLPESTQTHVHRVGDAIQPSHPLSSPSPALNLSQHQGLFKWVSSWHQVAKVLEFQLQHQSLQWHRQWLMWYKYDSFLCQKVIFAPLDARSIWFPLGAVSVNKMQIVVFQSLSHVWLLATSWTAACQVFLSFTISQSLIKLMSIKLMMPSNHLILCHPVLLPSVFPSIRSFPVSQLFAPVGQSIGALASASVPPVNIQGWFPLGLISLISLLFKRLSRVFSSTTVGKRSAFMVQLLHLIRASLIAQLVKNLPTMQETPVQFLGQEEPLEKG